MQSLEVGDPLIERFLFIIQTCEMALFAGKDNAAAMSEILSAILDMVTSGRSGLAAEIQLGCGVVGVEP